MDTTLDTKYWPDGEQRWPNSSGDARVAPEMMSEAENRYGRADRERTASSGKPELFREPR